MKKYTALFLLFFCFSITAQTNLDSLYKVLNNQSLTDSIRADTFKDYIVNNYIWSNPDTSIILSTELYDFSKRKEYSLGMAKALNLIGICYWVKGEYVSALNYYKQSIEICEKNIKSN